MVAVFVRLLPLFTALDACTGKGFHVRLTSSHDKGHEKIETTGQGVPGVHSRAHGRGIEVEAEEGAVVSHVVGLDHLQRVGNAYTLPLLRGQVHHG